MHPNPVMMIIFWQHKRQHTEEERTRARQDRTYIELFFIQFFFSSLISGHLWDWNRAASEYRYTENYMIIFGIIINGQ